MSVTELRTCPPWCDRSHPFFPDVVAEVRTWEHRSVLIDLPGTHAVLEAAFGWDHQERFDDAPVIYLTDGDGHGLEIPAERSQVEALGRALLEVAEQLS